MIKVPWNKIENKPIWSSELEDYFYWLSLYTLIWNEAKQILQALMHMSSDLVIITSKQRVSNHFILYFKLFEILELIWILNLCNHWCLEVITKLLILLKYI